MKQESSLVLEFFFALKTRYCWNDPISFAVFVRLSLRPHATSWNPL